MWQRIQTLYLALACGIVAALFFSPLAVAIGDGGAQETIYFTDNVYFLCLMISIALANLLALVLFKHRGLQMRVTVIAGLLLLGFQIWLAVRYFTAPEGIVFKFTAILPLVAAILDFLALRGILADQFLVESYGRLRSSKKNRR
ncbi:MAG: DUF4293 domain-containing protein [Bacteroidales bacterium]|nr:DUF4293 domain-containing protein [Bacteroidales bacterium]MBP5536757.1 DUF4293 domain-containing protein [Bacteroidales bacterium]MBP5795313.1 DUF4293 domain-containing protein [Bacteroidales bacterium]